MIGRTATLLASSFLRQGQSLKIGVGERWFLGKRG